VLREGQSDLFDFRKNTTLASLFFKFPELSSGICGTNSTNPGERTGSLARTLRTYIQLRYHYRIPIRSRALAFDMNQTQSPEILASGSQPTVARGNGVMLGGLLAVSTLLIWLLIIYNRFLTPHEGWFSYYGLLMKSGKVPYRDFYFFTQPVHLLIARVVSEFGDKLIYFVFTG